MAQQPCATIAKLDPVDQAVLALARLLGQAAARAMSMPEPAAAPHDRQQDHPHAEQHDSEPTQEEAAAQL